MTICVYCQSEYSDERLDAGYDYCLAEECQKLGLDKSEREFRKEYTPALLHKSNYFWIKKSELKTLNVRSDLL
jgi:reverse gyrase